jgi:hypothetical protein
MGADLSRSPPRIPGGGGAVSAGALELDIATNSTRTRRISRGNWHGHRHADGCFLVSTTGSERNVSRDLAFVLRPAMPAPETP